MLPSLSNPFQRSRAERPSGAYMQGPNRSSATAAMRRKPSAPASGPVASPKRQRDELRDALQRAMNERRYDDALNHILGLVALDPNDPRWPHKYGDVLRSLRRHNEAAAAYRRAARRYEAAGFPVRATAMMRLACELEGDGSPGASQPAPEQSRRMISGAVNATVPLAEEDLRPLIKAG